MALSWDLRKVHDVETLHKDEDQWRVTERLIWSTIAVDMGEITVSNWQEFYARVRMWELVVLQDSLTQPADVHRRIGMKCNVAYETRTKWLQRVMGSRLDEFERYAEFTVEEEQ